MILISSACGVILKASNSTWKVGRPPHRRVHYNGETPLLKIKMWPTPPVFLFENFNKLNQIIDTFQDGQETKLDKSTENKRQDGGI